MRNLWHTVYYCHYRNRQYRNTIVLQQDYEKELIILFDLQQSVYSLSLLGISEISGKHYSDFTVGPTVNISV